MASCHWGVIFPCKEVDFYMAKWLSKEGKKIKLGFPHVKSIHSFLNWCYFLYHFVLTYISSRQDSTMSFVIIFKHEKTLKNNDVKKTKGKREESFVNDGILLLWHLTENMSPAFSLFLLFEHNPIVCAWESYLHISFPKKKKKCLSQITYKGKML